MQWIGAYWVLINIITLGVYGCDKWKAKHQCRRIPEKTLLGLAVIGGATGAYVGMKIFRHKTMKMKFSYGVPMLLITQIIVFLVLWKLY